MRDFVIDSTTALSLRRPQLHGEAPNTGELSSAGWTSRYDLTPYGQTRAGHASL